MVLIIFILRILPIYNGLSVPAYFTIYVKNSIDDKTITDIGLHFIWQIIFDALVVSVYLALQNQNALCYTNDVRFPCDKDEQQPWYDVGGLYISFPSGGILFSKSFWLLGGRVIRP